VGAGLETVGGIFNSLPKHVQKQDYGGLKPQTQERKGGKTEAVADGGAGCKRGRGKARTKQQERGQKIKDYFYAKGSLRSCRRCQKQKKKIKTIRYPSERRRAGCKSETEEEKERVACTENLGARIIGMGGKKNERKGRDRHFRGEERIPLETPAMGLFAIHSVLPGRREKKRL